MKTTKSIILSALLGLLAVSTVHARGSRGTNDSGLGQSLRLPGNSVTQVCPYGNLPGSGAQAMEACDGSGSGQGKAQGKRGQGTGTGTPVKDGSGKAKAPGNGPKNGTGPNADCPNG